MRFARSLQTAVRQTWLRQFELNLRRAQLRSLGLIFGVTFIIVVVGMLVFVGGIERDAMRHRHDNQAKAASWTLTLFFEHARDTLENIAQSSPAALRDAPGLVQSLLMHEQAKMFIELARFDASGQLVADAYQDTPVLANLFTVRQSNWFLAARSGKSYLSHLFVSDTGIPYVIYAIPAPDHGVVAARLNLEPLWTVVADMADGQADMTYIVDAQGRIIAHPDPEHVVWTNATLEGRPEFVQYLSSGQARYETSYVNFQGVRVFGIMALLSDTGWTVVTEEKESEAFRTSRLALMTLGGAMCLFALIILTATDRLAKAYVFDPVATLRAGAHWIAQGDLSHQIPEALPNEIGQVAMAFNQMTVSLRERDARILAQTTALAAEVQEREQAQQALRNANAQLEQRVHDRTLALQQELAERQRVEQELIRAHAQALEASRLKSEFLATVSHEIRTPMNGIVGTVDLLATTQLTPEQADYMTTVRTSALSLLTIISDVLDFSKMEAGKLELDVQPFSVAAVVEDAADLLATDALRKGLTLVTEIGPEIPDSLQGDAARLRQVLVNLVGNAVKFTKRGEVVIRVCKDSEQWESHARACMVLRFLVHDTGEGVKPEQTNAVFEPFVQGDGSHRRRHGGTGLGLAIAKRTVHLMGGEIGVESQPGIGSTFWFTAKLARAGAAEPRRGLAQLAPGEEARALCVIASPTERRIAWRYLTAAGLRIDAVATPTEASSLLEAAVAQGYTYRYVLVDLEQAVTAGKLLIGRVQNDPQLAGTGVVALVNRCQGQADGTATALSGAKRVIKPIKRETLWQALQDSLAPPAGMAQALLPPPPEANNRMPARDTTPEATILLVEDNLVNQKVMLRQLEKLGYGATLAANGRVAVEAALRHDYCLILMDCQMPEMDGIEATRQLRTAEQGTARRVPIVALTANAADQDREACLAAGMDDYLAKPIRLEQLAQVVKQWLS